MAQILAISSWVACGHVGLSAAAPVLQILGHDVVQMPTVQLSNHPGFPHVAGGRTPPEQMRALADTMSQNGLLAEPDAILTGYLPSADHVDLAVQMIARFATPRTRVVVDPVLGDNPKGLYIAEAAAEALRDRLVPRADVLTPNAFELSWLTGLETTTPSQAATAARVLGVAHVLVTSAPFAKHQTGVLSVTSGGAQAFPVPQAPQSRTVPNGVGDVFSALVAAGLPPGHALGHLQTLIADSLDAPHLRIAQAAPRWTQAGPVIGA